MITKENIVVVGLALAVLAILSGIAVVAEKSLPYSLKSVPLTD